MKLTIYFIFIFIFINSCQTKKISQDKDIIENIPFLEKDNKIIIRNFYIDYNINKKNGNPTNIQELEKLLKSKKILYKILNTKKEGSYFIIDLIANNNLYKIILDKTHCTSYLFYDKKDTICFKGYSNILISFFQ